MRIVPERKIKKRQIFIYLISIIVCVLAVILAMQVQFYARIDLFGNSEEQNKYEAKTSEEKLRLENEFTKIFDNMVHNVSEANNNKRNDKNVELVYTGYENTVNVENEYYIDVQIPIINIDNEEVEKFTLETAETFYKKAIDILEADDNNNVIYTVTYTANVYNDILSLVLSSTLKEGSSAQREIVQTFNYDLRNNKKISLEEVLDIEALNTGNVQNQINEKIEEEEKKANDLLSLGYQTFDRDIENEMYLIKNIEQFYITNNEIYLIFAYGNNALTNETDIIVL